MAVFSREPLRSLTNALRVMSDSASAWFSNGKAIFQLPMGFSLALVGAGYLIGIVGGLAMLFGTFIAWGGSGTLFHCNRRYANGCLYY